MTETRDDERLDALRRQKFFLAATMVVLALLLAGLSWFVVSLSTPLGAPKKQNSAPSGLTWIRSIYAWGPTPDQALVTPVDVATAPDGTIWTVSNHTALVAFSPDGRSKRVVTFKYGSGAGEARSMEGLAVAENGDVYVAEYSNNKIMVISPSGTLLREWGVQLPMEVAVRNGRVAVAAAYGVGIFDTQGNLISKWGSRGKAEGQVDLPHGIAIAADGTVYISDTQNHRIQAFSPDGKVLWAKQAIQSRAGTSTASASTESEFQLPAGMTIDGAGRLVFVDPFGFDIVAMDSKAKGAVTGRWGEYGTTDGFLAYPTGISYDPARDYYVVADTSNNRLQVYSIVGSGGSFTTSARRFLDQPVWVFSIPLLLLLAAIVLLVINRRRAQAAEGAVGAE